jgi:hypothetical protein
VSWVAIAESGVFEFGGSKFVFDEERPSAGSENSESAEDLFFGEFGVFATELLEDGGEEFVLRVIEGIENLLVEADDSLFVNSAVCRERHRFDGLPGSAFEALEESSSSGVYKEDGFAAASCASGASDAVDVGFAIAWEVVVDDVCDAWDIESACGDIGGDDEVDLSGFELFDDAFALSLRHFAIEGCCAVSILAEELGEWFCGAAESNEDDGCVDGFAFEEAEEGDFLLVISGDDVALSDGVSSGGFLSDFDIGGIAEVLLGDFADGFGHGGGEEGRLAGLRELFEDRLDAFGEAHFEHFVGFIEYEAAEVFEFE